MTFFAGSLIFAILLVGRGGAAPADDACSPDVPDQCLFDVLPFGNKDITIPKDDAELDSFCGKVAEAEKCLKGYVDNCLKSVSKQVATIFIKNVMDQVNDWCGPNREEFFLHTKCLLDKKAELDQCMTDLVVILKTITETVEADDIIPQACCSFNTFSTCLMDSIQSGCSEDTAKFIDNLVKTLTSDLLDLVCSAYQPGSEACTTLPPIPPPPKGSKMPKTVVLPLLSMVDLL